MSWVREVPGGGCFVEGCMGDPDAERICPLCDVVILSGVDADGRPLAAACACAFEDEVAS